MLKAPSASLRSDFVPVDYELKPLYLNGISVLELAIFKRRAERAFNFDVERFMS